MLLNPTLSGNVGLRPLNGVIPGQVGGWTLRLLRLVPPPSPLNCYSSNLKHDKQPTVPPQLPLHPPEGSTSSLSAAAQPYAILSFHRVLASVFSVLSAHNASVPLACSVSPVPLRVTMSTGTIFNQPKATVSLPEDLVEAINAGAGPYPIPDGKEYGYGTAGVGPRAPRTNTLLTVSSSA